MIDITGVNLVKFVQEVYNLSKPQGMGFMHFTPEPLSDSDAARVIDESKNDTFIELSLDYVNGRSCKMTIFKDGDKRFIRDAWYDHGPSLLKELLEKIDRVPAESTEQS